MHVVNETFCSIPTSGTNCQYLVRLTSEASAIWYKPTKNKGSNGDVSVISPMLKLAKDGEEGKGSKTVRVAYLSLVGSFCFIFEFLLYSWKYNLMHFVVESLLPYQRPILLDFWRDNITNLVINFDFPCQRPILPHLGLLF